MALACVGASAQQKIAKSPAGGADRHQQSDNAKATSIRPDVKMWRMTDDYTLADTATVDTITMGHQVSNIIWLRSIGNVTLGNDGSPSTPSIFEDRMRVYRYGNIFSNAISAYIEYPENHDYYNTKTPYTNLTYQMGYPKRRSDEYVQALFTQNVNRRLNVGFRYRLRTSIGRYEAQRADHISFRLFGSYDGDNYGMTFSGLYSTSKIYENGGVVDDDYVLNPDEYEYSKSEDIPIRMMNARNNNSSYQLHFAHSYNLGHLTTTLADSSQAELPLTTVFHSLHIDYDHREHRITDLPTLLADTSSFIYDREKIKDLNQTADSVKYLLVSNMFQIKFNEEANSILHFGARAFVGNDIRRYTYPADIRQKYDANGNPYMTYGSTAKTRVESYLGGELFKNIGRNLRWKAGGRLYLQGKRTGDVELNGKVDTEFRILGRTAGFYAHGRFELRSPELFENDYYSNHFEWHNDFDRVKSLSAKGGIRIVENKIELSAYLNTLNSYIYFGPDGMPTQENGVVQIMAFNAFKHFEGAGFNSYNKLTWQKSSNEEAIPLPQLTVYSSNFYEHLFFGVLTLQIGADIRYETAYYAPQYIPAIMQFATQSRKERRKVGDHPYIDPFLNFQLKRARIYVKYEHINNGWPTHNSFHTIHYPANPGTLKFGVSWNFYD